MKLKLILLLCSLPLFFFAQNTATLEINATKTNEAPQIDGDINDECWNEANPVGGQNWQYFPYDTLQAAGQTIVKMCYDDEFLYVAIRCQTIGNDFVVQSLRRDFGFPNTDNVTLVFDTYHDRTNAFVFGITPLGMRREALVSNGGRDFRNFDASWDNKWFGDAQQYDDYWTAEYAIPFKTLRFVEGSQDWGFNFYRNDAQQNEWSTWNRIPRNNRLMDLTYTGLLHFERPLKKPGTNISIIPYLSGQGVRDFENIDESKTDWSSAVGGDAKIAVTSGLNLDLTINPDFSQVEVDQQVTNLDRFEIFFPERRQFFLENADLFGGFGLGRVNPFFSRRIGVAIDTTTGLNVQNPIQFGARLSGKVTERLRIGLLNMQTAPLEQSGLPGFNYSVATVQQQVFDRSNVSFVFVNKTATGGEDDSELYDPYNRVAGLEYRLASTNNNWSGKALYHQAFTTTEEDHKFAQSIQIEHLQRRFRAEWAHVFVGNGFDAQVGFVPRKDILLMSPEVEIFFFPKKGNLTSHSFNLDTRFVLKPGKDGSNIVKQWGMSDRQTELEWRYRSRNNVQGGITISEDDLILLEDFDPTRLQDDDVVLPAGTRYHYWSVTASMRSDNRKVFSYSIQPTLGNFYNGFRVGMRTGINWRYQPYAAISLDVNYNYIELDAPFKPVHLWVVGPRIDLTFSKTFFLTTFIQYNNQLDNLNVNARLQWRFAPVSDFFLVYTDNYLTDNFSQFGVRNRALVGKVTYWLNL